jgi:hypothetical protein
VARSGAAPSRRAAIDAIVGPVVERDALARQHLIEHAVREELIWRPWQLAGARLEGREHLERAAAAGRGVIASLVHSGPFPAAAVSLTWVTPRTYAVVGRWMRVPGPDERLERRRLRWLASFEEAGVRTVDAPGSYPVLVEVLRAGDLVLLAYDAPGPYATMFLGRPILLGTGTARLAVETGALVVRGSASTPPRPQDAQSCLRLQGVSRLYRLAAGSSFATGFRRFSPPRAVSAQYGRHRWRGTGEARRRHSGRARWHRRGRPGRVGSPPQNRRSS